MSDYESAVDIFRRRRTPTVWAAVDTSSLDDADAQLIVSMRAESAWRYLMRYCGRRGVGVEDIVEGIAEYCGLDEVRVRRWLSDKWAS